MPVSKATHSTSPAERFIDPDHSEVFHEVMKSKQEGFTVRKQGNNLNRMGENCRVQLGVKGKGRNT